MSTTTTSRPRPAARRASTSTRRRTTVPRQDEILLTVEGRALLSERARYLRDVALPDLRPHLVARERDERVVADFERLSAEAEWLERVVATAGALPAYDDDEVHLGSRVLIEMPDGERTWVRPVHAVEAFLDDERVSLASPVSQALIGARPGDLVPVEGPAGTWSCAVLEVVNHKPVRASRRRKPAAA
jgi:transcription elongation GreA/GreB family factor